MSIGHYFYRKRTARVILALVAMFAVACFAQSGRKKDKGPRALAVVELPANGKSAGRLIPITILDNGRFWDAGAYLADPRPLALDPGNVYEVERSGEPVGIFVISDAREVNDQWLGYGQWEPRSTKAASKQPETPTATQSRSAEDDDRPVLHKSPASAPAPESRAPAQAASEPARPPEDPNRPVLRRGKPKSQPQESDFETGSTGKPAAPTPATPFKAGEVLAAISDAGGPEPHGYKYDATPAEQEKLKKAITDLATEEVARYAKKTPGRRFVPAGSFDQVAIRVFDLHYDNYPEVVFTARVPGEAGTVYAHGRNAKEPPPPTGSFYFYVTVVGQTDLYGQMRKLFSSVTDSQHLDAFPRLELVDGVDAEGTGRGDLLFRAFSGDTPTYQVYHVGPDSLRKLFDSGGNY